MRKLLFIALLGVAAWSTLSAQTFEVTPIGGRLFKGGKELGSISETDAKDNDTSLKYDYGYGVRLTINTPGYYGHEVGYLRNYAKLTTRTTTGASPDTPVVLQDRITVHQAFYNFLMYFMPKNERWRPFMTGGLQMYEYGIPNLAEWTKGKSRNYGVNYGLGLKLMPAKHVLIRFDFRDYAGGKPYGLNFKTPEKSGGLIHQVETTMGIGIGF